MTPTALTLACTAPPQGSQIRVRESSGSLRLHWTTPPRLSWDRWFAGGLTGIWLLGWSIGGVAALWGLLSTPLGARTAMFIAWLLVWTIGELHMAMTLVNLVRGPGAERLDLTEQQLCLQPGSNWTWKHLGRLLRGSKWEVRVSRHQLSSLRLDTTEGRQRLIFDHSVHRIEIGRHLADADREWLADVIWKWVNDGGYR